MEITQLVQNILRHKSILIIDDEDKIREILSKYLKRSSCEADNIVHATEGSEAIRKIMNQDFDFIIIDIVLPKKNGLEVFQEIRRHARTKNTPVLLMSGNLQSQVVKKAIIMGAKHILAKPFNYVIFMEKVFRCLELKS